MKRTCNSLLLIVLFAIAPLQAQPVATDTTTDTAVTRVERVAPPHVRFDSSDISVRRAPEETLKEYMADEDFAYDLPRQETSSFWQYILHWLSSGIKELFGETDGDFWKTFWEVVAYVVVGATMVYVTMKMVGVEPAGLFRRAEKGTDIDVDVHEENIHAMDFDALIARAVAGGDYRWAIRLHYLRILKQLADRGLIAWKPEKTNHDYLYELKRGDLHGAFLAIIILFEYAWYGNLAVDSESFGRAERQFTEFQQRMRAGT
jgi:hypothetical protein